MLTLNRRNWIRYSGALAGFVFHDRIHASQLGASESLIQYLEGLRTADGGYGWGELPRGHLTSTYAAIGCYHLLGKLPPDHARAVSFIRDRHPFQLKKLEREMHVFERQQIEALTWLNADTQTLRDVVAKWKGPLAYPKNYEAHGYPVFEYEVMMIVCRELVGLPIDESCVSIIDYIEQRRRPDGSFNNTPASDDSAGHIVNTYWGLRALRAAGRFNLNQPALVSWLQSCQDTGGGFCSSSQRSPMSNNATPFPDVYFTWAGIHSLRMLGARMRDESACIGWLEQLMNPDGGFAPRRGWLSNPLATYYALDALSALNASSRMVTEQVKSKSSQRHVDSEEIPKKLKVFTVQLEAHGTGSPEEAVSMARDAKVHLWGAKNAKPEWLAAAQAIAKREQVNVQFFAANEEYGTFFQLPGFGTYSHLSDVCYPANAHAGESLANQSPVTWEQFREQRLKPLTQVNGLVYWQFNENECLTRDLLDDSLRRRGYAAIASFHFGNPDFTNSEPFLMQYRGQIPYVALLDAHGPEAWWFGDQFWGMRTLFFAEQPTYESFVAALNHHHVVAVRHDVVTEQETWMHGSPAALKFAREREADWKWWDETDSRRPWASIVSLNPTSRFEAGQPKQGWGIRVRCRAENTTQGKVKRLLAKLVELRVDGEFVKFEEVRQGDRAPWNDLYWTHYCENQPKAIDAIVERLDNRERMKVSQFALLATK